MTHYTIVLQQCLALKSCVLPCNRKRNLNSLIRRDLRYKDVINLDFFYPCSWHEDHSRTKKNSLWPLLLTFFPSGSFVVPVFVWRCQQASPGRAVGAPADASLTPMIGVTSAGTGATMPMTAIASAREEAAAAAGEGIQSILLVVMTDEINFISAR